jgi:hypothetical protein
MDLDKELAVKGEFRVREDSAFTTPPPHTDSLMEVEAPMKRERSLVSPSLSHPKVSLLLRYQRITVTCQCSLKRNWQATLPFLRVSHCLSRSERG